MVTDLEASMTVNVLVSEEIRCRVRHDTVTVFSLCFLCHIVPVRDLKRDRLG